MYPHERSLVTKMKDEPFALIGVNADPQIETVKKTIKDNQLNWRTFWDGPSGADGPIARSWNVHGWPSIFVLDGEGRIRYKHTRGEAMDKAIETLLAELKSAAPKSGRAGR
jgi:peroxiredoxin